jgi:hypothetical protein
LPRATQAFTLIFWLQACTGRVFGNLQGRRCVFLSGSSSGRSVFGNHCPRTKLANLRFQPISLIQYCRRVIPSGGLKLAQLKH